MDLAQLLAGAAGVDVSTLTASRLPFVQSRAPSGRPVSGAVSHSPDLARVLALPQRVWYEGLGGRHGTAERVRELADAVLRQPGSTATLRLVQAVALQELHDFRGLLGMLRVGAGKTLLSLLAPVVMRSRRPVLLVPASLRDKTVVERDQYARDWRVPRVVTDPSAHEDGTLLLLSYTQISTDRPEILASAAAGEDDDEVGPCQDGEATDDTDEDALRAAARRPSLLDRLAPDLLICDEAHALKNARSGRTRKVRRHIRARRAEEHAAGEPHGTRLVFAGMTGTAANDSIREYAHLLAWALGPLAPVPLAYPQLCEWADCLDESSQTMRAVGALARLVPQDWQEELLVAPTRTARRAYARRLVSSPGVVAVASSDRVTARLTVRAMHLAPTPEQVEAFATLRERWETPDGQPFSQATDLWRHAREIACGFYYRWIERPPDAWLEARREWCRFVRDALARGERRGIDTELAVVRACERGEMPRDALDEWRGVRDTFVPKTEAVWLTHSVLERGAEWLVAHPQGLCWVEHVCVGTELARVSGVPYFRQGGKAGKTTIESHHGAAILSIASNSQGRNLQRWRDNVIMSLPQRGQVWEQLLGRTHRDGQDADEVSVEVMIACREQLLSFEQARSHAEFASDASTVRQKLLDGDVQVAEPDPIPPGW